MKFTIKLNEAANTVSLTARERQNLIDILKGLESKGMSELADIVAKPLGIKQTEYMSHDSGSPIGLADLKKIIEDEASWHLLPDLDTSEITDMSLLFRRSKFNGDISKWDVSNVVDMSDMFEESVFNGDISKWDVSKVKNMSSMFYGSKFNGDISKWDVSKVENMTYMFKGSSFNGDISKWNVSKVENMKYMFKGSPLEKSPPF